MEFYEDDIVPPFDFVGEDEGEYEEDVSLEETSLFGIPIYDLPNWFEPTAVVVMVKGYVGDDEAPTLLFRASGNLAPYEIQAILAEGIRETL